MAAGPPMRDPLTQSSGQIMSPDKQSSFQVSGLDTATYPPGFTTRNVTTCPSMSVSTMVGDAFIKVVHHITAEDFMFIGPCIILPVEKDRPTLCHLLYYFTIYCSTCFECYYIHLQELATYCAFILCVVMLWFDVCMC
jgi:hypothetical protein